MSKFILAFCSGIILYKFRGVNMTKEELKNFYNEDEKLYDLNENKKFLYMFNHLFAEGYEVFIGIDEMQDMIDRLAAWYEIKFPEREFDFYDGKMTNDFSKFKELSDVMDIKQLFFRLTDNQQKLIEGLYRSNVQKSYPIYDMDKVVGVSKKVYYKVGRTENDKYFSKHKDFVVSADAETGLVDMDYEIEKYVSVDEIDVYNLVKLFIDEHYDKLDFSELEKASNNKYLDNYLRDRLLEFVALKLLYSRKTTPFRGYERAKRFMDEFNKKLDLNLSMDKLDNIMNRDYKEDRSKVKIISL